MLCLQGFNRFCYTGITSLRNLVSGKQTDWTCSKCLITVLPFHGVSTLDASSSSAWDNESLSGVSEEVLYTLHLNTQSMFFREFQLVINKHPFDVLTLSETWLKAILSYSSMLKFLGTRWNVGIVKKRKAAASACPFVRTWNIKGDWI